MPPLAESSGNLDGAHSAGGGLFDVPVQYFFRMRWYMAEGPAACVCVLFYGADNYCYKLARRVLSDEMCQFASEHPGLDFRFGFNAVGEDTKYFVAARQKQCFANSVVIDCPENIYKYPLMRRLFLARPITAPIVLWFDDDSCIAPQTDVRVWFRRLQTQLTNCAAIGSIYRAGISQPQSDWITKQSWYAGKTPGPYVSYATGGWWAAQSSVINKFDWPPQDLKQKDGDVMFGELLRQNDLSLQHFRDNMWINANDEGVEASVTRKKVPCNESVESSGG